MISFSKSYLEFLKQENRLGRSEEEWKDCEYMMFIADGLKHICEDSTWSLDFIDFIAGLLIFHNKDKDSIKKTFRYISSLYDFLRLWNDDTGKPDPTKRLSKKVLIEYCKEFFPRGLELGLFEEIKEKK